MSKILNFPDNDNFDESYSTVELICKWGEGFLGYSEFMYILKIFINLCAGETQNNIDESIMICIYVRSYR